MGENRRRLTSQEKKVSQKSIGRIERENGLFNIEREILETEIRLLPLKVKLTHYTKEQQLKKVRELIKMNSDTVSVLKDQVLKGVKRKDKNKETVNGG